MAKEQTRRTVKERARRMAKEQAHRPVEGQARRLKKVRVYRGKCSLAAPEAGLSVELHIIRMQLHGNEQ